MHAFLLAGGFATRLWPLTEHRAKPLLPLAGKPILTHILENIPPEIPVTVSTNAAFADAFEEWKRTINRPGIRIAIEQTDDDDRKLGTNGAVARWIEDEDIREDVLLLTGDNYLGFPLKTFLAAATPSRPLLAAYDIGDLSLARSFGTVMTAENGRRVTAFEEKPATPRTTLVSTGCYLIPADCLEIVKDYAADHPDHIGGIFEEFLRRGREVECFRFTEPWFDIGSFASYVDATRTLVGSAVLADPTARLATTVTEGSVVIGARSTVKQSTLRDTVIFEDCVIEDCVIEDCVIDRGCRLRGIDLTGKMLRAETQLMRDAAAQ